MATRDDTSIADAELCVSLRRHVDTLAGLIGPRHLARPSSTAAAIAYIERELNTAGKDVRHEIFDAKPGTATNLVLERQGTGRADEIVILGAHHDTVPETPGADDNASAIAVLIEVAKMTAGASTARTIRFVAFANEEPPHFMTDTMGSDVHARGCHARKEKIVAMLNLEMVGYYSDEPNSQRAPEQLPDWIRKVFPRRGNFLVAVGNLKSISLGWTFRRGFKRAVRFPLFSVSLPEKVREIRLSDHSSFWDFGYPALMLTDTSFFRNPNYHRATDTPATLDYARMGQVTRGVAGGLLRCAICR
jgi:Zn-dependent M28 family amino/carboxypeptidase